MSSTTTTSSRMEAGPRLMIPISSDFDDASFSKLDTLMRTMSSFKCSAANSLESLVEDEENNFEQSKENNPLDLPATSRPDASYTYTDRPPSKSSTLTGRREFGTPLENASRAASIRSLNFSSTSRSRRQKDFEMAMRDPVQYDALRAFAESVHSEENFMFLESLSALESLVLGIPMPSKGVSQALERFAKGLESENGMATPIGASNTVDVSGEFSVLYRKFHDSFISDTAPCEVNIPDTVKRQITDTLTSRETFLPSNVFDGAADEVLAMVYRDTYQKYIIRNGGLSKKTSMATLCQVETNTSEDGQWSDLVSPSSPARRRHTGSLPSSPIESPSSPIARERSKVLKAQKKWFSFKAPK